MNQIIKKRRILFNFNAQSLSTSLISRLKIESGSFDTRSFPDGETYLKIITDVKGADCIVVMNLSYPNANYLPLMFLVETLRELGASSVGLVAPYLCYMRQDRRFAEGEAVTSKLFARMLSRSVDWLVTVDPHLHRYQSLSEIYAIPSRIVHAAPALAEWLKTKVNVLLVGPDAESEQWVSDIAAISGHPFLIGEKQRHGDRDVQVVLPALGDLSQRQVIVIDDVISSGYTIFRCVQALQHQGVSSISCAAVHGIFAGAIDSILLESGLAEIITTNTIEHPSNCIDMAPLLVPVINACLSDQEGSV